MVENLFLRRKVHQERELHNQRNGFFIELSPFSKEIPDNIPMNSFVVPELLDSFEFLESIDSVDLVEEFVVLWLIRSKSFEMELGEMFGHWKFVFEQVGINTYFWVVGFGDLLGENSSEFWIIGKTFQICDECFFNWRRVQLFHNLS